MQSFFQKKTVMNEMILAFDAYEDKDVILQSLDPKIWKNIPICVCEAFELVRDEFLARKKMVCTAFQANRRVV